MSGTVNPEAVLAFSYRRWFQLYFTSNGPNKLRFVHTCRPLLLSLFFRLVIPLKKNNNPLLQGWPKFFGPRAIFRNLDEGAGHTTKFDFSLSCRYVL